MSATPRGRAAASSRARLPSATQQPPVHRRATARRLAENRLKLLPWWAMSRALRGVCALKSRACPGAEVTASVLGRQFPPQKLSVPSTYLFLLGAFKYMTQPLQHRQLFSCSSPLPPSSDTQSLVLEPVSVSSVKMGYSEIDEKAINTIRVLAVSFSVSPPPALCNSRVTPPPKNLPRHDASCDAAVGKKTTIASIANC